MVGRWLKYMKADYNYQPSLRPLGCENEEYEGRERLLEDDVRPVIYMRDTRNDTNLCTKLCTHGRRSRSLMMFGVRERRKYSLLLAY